MGKAFDGRGEASEGQEGCHELLLIGSAPDFESGIFHNDTDVLQDHCVIMKKNLGSTPKATKYIYHPGRNSTDLHG